MQRGYEGSATTALHAGHLPSLRPGGPCTIGHIERREDTKRFDRIDERGAPHFERSHDVRSKRAVLLVDEHLAPVFDDDVSGGLTLIAEEGTAQIRARLAIQDVPLPVRAKEVLEFGLPPGPHRELPHDCNHGG